MEKIVLKAGDQFYQKWSGLQKQSNRTDLIESMKYNLEQYNKSVVAAEKDTKWLKTFSESIKKVTE